MPEKRLPLAVGRNRKVYYLFKHSQYMKKRNRRIGYSWILVWLWLAQAVSAQQIEGHVYDAATGETLAGVNVYHHAKGTTQGVATDASGYYTFTLPDGQTMLTFSYLGYESQTLPVRAREGRTVTFDVRLHLQSNLMDEVVVSVGRYEQKLSDITVSMELLKAPDLARQAPTDLTAVLTTLPGVEVTDRQPSVRGGSGWTYGVGSRCLIMVDGMSVLTPGSGEINWNVIPMENVEQVEVLKGASSVLYGSSALNGLIHVRTKRPSLEPLTRVKTYMGIYGNPKNRDFVWWNRSFWKSDRYNVEPLLRKTVLSGLKNPIYDGIDLSHSRRIGHFDVTAGVNLFADESYRQGNYTRRLRAGGNLTYHDPQVHGLNYGLNANFLTNDYAGFFIWRSEKEAYIQSPLANMGREATTFYIDPFLNYTNEKKGTTHRFKGRFYRQANQIVSNTTDKSLVEISRNMGFDVTSLPDLVGTLQNWQTTLLPAFLPHLPGAMNGNMNGLMGELGKLGQQYFPSARPADYVDLISWVMGRTPLPSNAADFLPWLANGMQPASKKPEGDDHTTSYYLDYQFSKKFEHSMLTVGGTYERIHADSEMTGVHNSDNVAFFAQYDHKLFDRLNISAGVRLEYYRVDHFYREAETELFGAKVPVKPVLRGGLNYELGEHSFIRASLGQGYRYPSVVEKYVLKDIGGIGAFPNAELKAERGYNAELGFKQGYKWGNLKGYADAAVFYTRYKDMIEFRFGAFDKQTFDYVDNLGKLVGLLTGGGGIGIGAQFTNVGRAEIYGVDVSTSGVYDFNPHTRLTYNLGYVYTEPRDKDLARRNAEEEANTDLLAMRSKSNDSPYLKYRQKHTVKGVFDFEWKRLSIGTNLSWKSKTLAADYFILDEREKPYDNLMDCIRLLLFGDLGEYWKAHNTGFFTMDVRLGVQLTRWLRFQGIVNNVLNTEYSVRPMDIGAPRTFILQLSADF